MSQAPRLHIPQPPARPGEEPDFSYLEVPPAGILDQPDIDASPRAIEPLALGMIRVLDDDGQPVGQWQPELDAETLRTGLRHMMLTRIFDDRMLRMQRQGKISFYVKSSGEEAVAVAQCMALGDGDMLFPSYRNQGIQIARQRPLNLLMSHCLSNTKDMCKGRQMPVMYTSNESNLFTISGNLTTQFPQAVGWAMAEAIKGGSNIAASWIGEGSTAEPDFHHALTFASVYRAPVVLNVVNNQWAISTFQAFAGGENSSFAARATGYGLPGLRVDGNDFLAVYSATQWAAKRARAGHGATLIELVTYRADGHSTSDDPSRYRSTAERAAWPLGDPIERLQAHLTSIGEWSEEQHKALHAELQQHVKDEWKEAESHGTLTDGPQLNSELMFEDLFATMPKHLRRQRDRMVRLRDKHRG